MTEDAKGETQHPIITYTNRIQKQLDYVTSLVYSNQNITLAEKYALLGVVANLPPEAQTYLTDEHNKLLSGDPLTFEQFDKIYTKTHSWIYKFLLKEAFEKIKPAYGSGKF